MGSQGGDGAKVMSDHSSEVHAPRAALDNARPRASTQCRKRHVFERSAWRTGVHSAPMGKRVDLAEGWTDVLAATSLAAGHFLVPGSTRHPQAGKDAWAHSLAGTAVLAFPDA